MAVLLLCAAAYGCSEHNKTKEGREQAASAEAEAERANSRVSDLEYRIEALENRLGM